MKLLLLTGSKLLFSRGLLQTQSNNVHLLGNRFQVKVVGLDGKWRLGTGIGAGATPSEVAALFPPDELEDMDGMVMDMVSFVPWD